MKIAKISLGLSLLMSGPTLASDWLSTADFWVGAGLGMGQLEEPASHTELNSRAFSGKLDAGLDLNRDLGIYGSYDFIQDVHLGTLGLMGKYNLTDQMKLVGKMGVTYPFNGSDNAGFSTTTGLNIEYQWTQSISTRVGVDYYHDLSLQHGHSGDLYQATLGVSYRFGQHEQDTSNIVTENIETIEEEPIEVIKDAPVSDFMGNVEFDFNSSKPKSVRLLDEVTATLEMDASLWVQLIGHTDAVGSEAFNEALSLQRAEAVAQYIIEQGILDGRIVVSGEGERQPVASNDTREGRAQNRRVELFLK